MQEHHAPDEKLIRKALQVQAYNESDTSEMALSMIAA